MINLFHLPTYNISTADYDHFIHGSVVKDFERAFCDYVGARYGVAVNSATNAIFLSMLGKDVTCKLPTVIPPVVGNAIITSGNRIEFTDDVSWVGTSYTLHDFGDYKIIDSAQRVERGQFSEANDNDLMIFSFYPTKPVGSCDGGIIVSNSLKQIEKLKTLAYNGMTTETANWDRKLLVPGYKCYMNSIQADIATRNLSLLDAKNKRLSEIREQYNEHYGLNNTSGHLYQIPVGGVWSAMASMKAEHKIQTGQHYKCLHKLDAYKNIECVRKDTIFEKSERWENFMMSIPFHEKLTSEEIKHIFRGTGFVYRKRNRIV